MSRAPTLRNLKTAVFEAATANALETAVNDWLVARGEESLVRIEFSAVGSSQYNAFILYAEE